MSRRTLTRKCVIFFTLGMGLWARAEVTNPTGGPGQQKPIETTQTIQGEQKSWPGETLERQEHIYPTLWGQAGIFRVRSGYSLPEGAFSFGVGAEFYSLGGGPDVTATGPSTATTIAESLFIGYSPLKNLTLSLQRRNSSTTFSAPATPQQLISSLGDFAIGGSYAVDATPSLVIAPVLNIWVASDFNSLTPSGQTVSAGLGAAATYNFYAMTGLPLFAHANVLYHSPQVSNTGGSATETFYGFSRFHTMTLGLGVEWHLGDFIPFLEYYNTAPLGASVSYFNAPSKLTLGTRFTPLSNKSLAFLVGMDVGAGRSLASGVPFTAPVQVIAQVSYTTGFASSERKHYYTTRDIHVVNRKFIIKKAINFKVGSAILEPSSTPVLDQIADVILKNNVHKLLVVGHTDSSHTDDFNVKLSLDRANTVKNYLVSRGVGDEALMAQGYGKRKPRASNATEEGRALNRRVEFFIVE